MWLGIIALGLYSSSISQANGLQLVSARAAALGVSAGGNGTSDLPIVSADGRYVAFASTAGNLVTNPNPSPVSALTPHSMQVFIRDRMAGTTTLVSVNAAGYGGNGDSFPDGISTNGQFVLFESAASDLTGNDTNNATDIFLRDLVNHTTTFVSVNTNGAAANGNSYNATMTPDGRYVAFVSAATDVTANDTNGIPDVFVRDRLAGTTVMASVGAMGSSNSFPPATSEAPDITPDGHFVAFYTTATNVISGVTNVGQIFVRDLIGHTTIWASTNAPIISQAQTQPSEISCNPRISGDGLYVAFEVCSNFANVLPVPGLVLRYNLQTGLTDTVFNNAVVPAVPLANMSAAETMDMTPDGQSIACVAYNNTAQCVEVWSAQSGTITNASLNRSGGVSSSDISDWPRLDATGRYVTFLASAANLTTGTVIGYNCYQRDLLNGTTSLISVDTNGNGGGASPLTPPAISSDGQTIAFVANDGSLVANDNNGMTDVFVRNNTGATTEMISARDPGQPNFSANGLTGFTTINVSSNGQFVAFASEANDLVANDTNSEPDVFVRDVVNGTNILVSVNTNGAVASGMSIQPSISADGRYVAFTSSATDLIAGDTNNSYDVFVRDLQTGTTTLASKNIAGNGEGIGHSYSPTLSADGRYVLYYSAAQNLTSGSYAAGAINLFLRDRQLGTNYALTFGNANSVAMTPDGHRVALVGSLANTLTTPSFYVWDTLQTKLIYTNNPSGNGETAVAISPDGNLAAYVDTQLKVINLTSKAVTVVSSGPFTGRLGGGFSKDDKFLVYSTAASNTSTDTNSLQDVYLYDFQAGTSSLISHNYISGGSPNGVSDSPTISADGRFIAYRTLASHAVANDANGVGDLLLYDRSDAMTFLISLSSAGNWTANNRSYLPVFSADSKSLAFLSWASDLTSQSPSLSSEVFELPLTGAPVVTTNGDGNAVMVSGLNLLAPGMPGVNQHPVLTWPATNAGAFYQVQYKNDLTDPVWHVINGTVTISGNGGQIQDLAPATTNRFYRIILSN